MCDYCTVKMPFASTLVILVVHKRSFLLSVYNAIAIFHDHVTLTMPLVDCTYCLLKCTLFVHYYSHVQSTTTAQYLSVSVGLTLAIWSSPDIIHPEALKRVQLKSYLLPFESISQYLLLKVSFCTPTNLCFKIIDIYASHASKIVSITNVDRTTVLLVLGGPDPLPAQTPLSQPRLLWWFSKCFFPH